MNKNKYYFLLVLLAVAGAITAVSLLGTMSAHVNAFEFQIALQVFDHGFTEIRLPPLGSIRAQTHETPFKITVTLTNIDLQGIKNLLEADPEGEAREITDQFREDIYQIVKRYIFRLILLASIGGGFAVTLLRPKRRLTYIIGLLIGATLMSGSLFHTYRTYDLKNFENPEFRGVLEVAPWMISFTQEAIVKVDKLGRRLQIVAENLFQVYQTLETLELREPLDSNLRVLHISDIHNNPAAFDFVRQIARSFRADFIINTGDETDFGTPLESIIFQQIVDLKIPYVFLGGNHDSPETLKAISQIDNVVLLDRDIVQLKGLTILGFSDPASKSAEITPMGVDELNLNVAEIQTFIEESQLKPDILAVHNHRLAHELAGVAPMIMHGHDHKVAITERDETIILDAGTTGASGIRGLQTVNETPYSVLLLYFKVEEERIVILTAVDVFKVHNLRTGFTLERTVLNKIISGENGENGIENL
ncbi:MAG: metallophosphoesterase [Clostridia bacterium]|jgi:predicted phosphodiesterase|nr:metallophosphoesterase [Clostridia bacterium]